MPDDLALLLGIFHTLEQVEEAILGLDEVEVQVKVLAQVADHFLAFVEAQQTVVHEDAVQAMADGLVQQHGHHGGVDAAGKGADHVLVTDLFGHFLDHAFHEAGHAPVGHDVADLEQEVAQHGVAVHAVVHFGMELHGVDLAAFIGHGSHFEGGGAAGDHEAGRGSLDLVAVAHPHAAGLGAVQAVPQGAGGFQGQVGRAVFAGQGLGQFAAQVLGQQLHAVADAQHRHAQFQEALVQGGGIGFAHAGRTAGKDDGRRSHSGHFGGGDVAGMDFGIHAGFTHTSCDELGDLRTVVNDNDLAVRHECSLQCMRTPPGRDGVLYIMS